MTTDDSARKCASTCWYVSVGVGLLLSVALIAGADWALLWALLFGVVAFLIFGFVLPQLVCTGSPQRPMASQQPSSSLVAGDPAAPLPGGPHASAASAAAATPPYIGGDAEGEDRPAPQAHPVASEARRARPDDAPTSAAPASAPETAPKKAEPKPNPADGSEGKKPETLSAPRAGGADDLKMIKGVGPKLEKMLNDMGFYHYDQIATWSDAEVAWVDANVPGFKGRATRDDWRGQAKTLASGGTTDSSTRASKGGVH